MKKNHDNQENQDPEYLFRLMCNHLWSIRTMLTILTVISILSLLIGLHIL